MIHSSSNWARRSGRACKYLYATILASSLTSPALAQEPAGAMNEEIVVTARKREETALRTPVILTAIDGAQLERRDITSLDNVARLVPQLVMGVASGGTQGGTVALRGIGSGESNPFIDQSVAFNVDGVQIARANVRRLSQMDMEAVEVLKGPQALFFGKNSPAGVISIRTADPSDRLEGKASLGYEFVGREKRAEGYVSGPLAPNLGVRIAAYASDLDGWVKNVTPRTEPLAPHDRRLPVVREYAVRATLKYEAGDKFDARLKLSGGRARGTGPAANTQLWACPYGFDQFGGVDDCKANDRITHGDNGPNPSLLDPGFLDGVPHNRLWQILGSLELNFRPSDKITITSVTGYFRDHTDQLENFQATYNPSLTVPARIKLALREWSQEFRVTSNFKGPFDFMVGTHLQSTRSRYQPLVVLFSDDPIPLLNDDVIQKGKAWSVFGQAIFRIVPSVELSAGGRYSVDKKRLPTVRRGEVGQVVLPEITTAVDHGRWTDFSPEVTATWFSSDDLTLFASYKEGFLSGGFNPSASDLSGDISYEPQGIKGFEGGIKARLLGNRLRVNFGIYSYKLTNLQLTTSVGAVLRVINAGASKVRGAEFDFSYSVPAITGLNLNGSLAYNRARYTRFTTACYSGQTAALGCNTGPQNDDGSFSLQDLAGTSLPRAPKWAGGLGLDYETPVGGGLKVGFSADARYTGGYFTDAQSVRFGRQEGYEIIDASVRVGREDERWRLALIGRNLTNTYYVLRNSQTFGGSPGPLPDLDGWVSRGREVIMQATFKFGG